MFSSGKFSQLTGNECKGSLSTIANLEKGILSCALLQSTIALSPISLIMHQERSQEGTFVGTAA